MEAWVRVGAVRCARPTQGAEHGYGAFVAFERAERIDPSYEELWTERARCHLAQHSAPQALVAARRAVALDPDAVDAATVLASALEQTGAAPDALRWLDGLVVREPRSREAQHAMLDYANRHGDTARAHWARAALRELGAATGNADGAPARRAIDDALILGNDNEAQTQARSAHLSQAEVALRAAALGRLAAARSVSEKILSADPNDSDARVAAMVAADLSGDWEGLGQYALQVPHATRALSPSHERCSISCSSAVPAWTRAALRHPLTATQTSATTRCSMRFALAQGTHTDAPLSSCLHEVSG